MKILLWQVVSDELADAKLKRKAYTDRTYPVGPIFWDASNNQFCFLVFAMETYQEMRAR